MGQASGVAHHGSGFVLQAIYRRCVKYNSPKSPSRAAVRLLFC